MTSTSDVPPSTSAAPADTSATKIKFGRWDLDPREVFAETKLSLAIVNFKPVVKGHVLVLPWRMVPRYKDMTPEEVCWTGRQLTALQGHHRATRTSPRSSSNSTCCCLLPLLLPAGHVLVLPRHVVPRYKDMTPQEVTDMWLLAQKIGQAFEPHHGCSSSTFTIQDGPAAGQTVAHVHVHVMPRREGDFVPNDKIYNEPSPYPNPYPYPCHIEENEKEAKKLRMDAEENRPARTMDDMEAEAKELSRVLEEFEKKEEEKADTPPLRPHRLTGKSCPPLPRPPDRRPSPVPLHPPPPPPPPRPRSPPQFQQPQLHPPSASPSSPSLPRLASGSSQGASSAWTSTPPVPPAIRSRTSGAISASAPPDAHCRALHAPST
ncbi:unnamed protein product [Closterium sp. NIES-54]